MTKESDEFKRFGNTMNVLINVSHEATGPPLRVLAGGPFKPFFGLSGAFFLVASRTYRRGSQVTAQKPGGNLGHRAKEY